MTSSGLVNTVSILLEALNHRWKHLNTFVVCTSGMITHASLRLVQVQNVVRMLRAGLANPDQVAGNIFATDAGEVRAAAVAARTSASGVLCDDGSEQLDG